MFRAEAWVKTDTCVNMLAGSRRLGITALAQHCEDYIVKNFEAVVAACPLTERQYPPEQHPRRTSI